MAVNMGWTRVPDLDIPAWDLDADSSYYIEKWGLGSFAVYHNAERIPDSTTTYGSLEAAQIVAEVAYRADPDGPAPKTPELTGAQLAIARRMAGTDYEIRHMLTAYEAGQLDTEGLAALVEELEG